MKHELPALPYAYGALEPFIDARTMEIHHSKHHQAYVDKLNAALEKFPEVAEKPLEELLKNIDAAPAEIRTAIRNAGGGHWNHSFFWKTMFSAVNGSTAQPPINAVGPLKAALYQAFGNMENFKKTFFEAAINLFGSGWCWLIKTADGQLQITTTANQDTPLALGHKPILCIDLWEHAYYLKYQNRRAEYLENWWQVINWPEAEKNFLV